LGSAFDASEPTEEVVSEEARAGALKETPAWQVRQAVEKGAISKVEMARRMNTRRGGPNGRAPHPVDAGGFQSGAKGPVRTAVVNTAMNIRADHVLPDHRLFNPPPVRRPSSGLT
jgi:hypothetical protein